MPVCETKQRGILEHPVLWHFVNFWLCLVLSNSYAEEIIFAADHHSCFVIKILRSLSMYVLLDGNPKCDLFVIFNT